MRHMFFRGRMQGMFYSLAQYVTFIIQGYSGGNIFSQRHSVRHILFRGTEEGIFLFRVKCGMLFFLSRVHYM